MGILVQIVLEALAWEYSCFEYSMQHHYWPLTQQRLGVWEKSILVKGREPRSCFGWVFNFKLGHIALLHHKCTAHIQPLLELKTRPRFCPVSLSLPIPCLWVVQANQPTSLLNNQRTAINGSFTLAMFVCKIIGDSDTRQALDCRDSHVTALALASLGNATQIGWFLFLSFGKGK
jgi:hypothetical protein